MKNLWRDPAGALPNALALGYAIIGYLAGFVLMAQPSLLLAPVGVLLTVHAMVIAAYLIHEAAHYNLFASPVHNRIAGEAMSWMQAAPTPRSNASATCTCATIATAPT
jgi:fatty acid desaturase